MLGMNDGYYRPPNPAVQKTYQDGYRSMVDTILKGAPGVRLASLRSVTVRRHHVSHSALSTR